MDVKPKISVIIPVYNAEKYLAECINSILDASDISIEILIVNDGSTDSSPKICDEFAAQDSRIKVFHRENSGPANARNYALNISQGEWVTFVDADDSVEKGYFDCLDYKRYSKYDLIFTNLTCLSIGGKTTNNIQKEEEIIDIRDLVNIRNQCFDVYYRVPYRKISYTVCKFYKNDIIKEHNLKFPSNLFYFEDAIFLYSYLEFAKSVIFLDGNSPKYVYRIVESSLTNVINERVIEKKKDGLNYLVSTYYNEESAIAIERLFIDQIYVLAKLIALNSKSWLSAILKVRDLYSWSKIMIVLRHSQKEADELFKNQRIGFCGIKYRLLYLYVLKVYLKNKRINSMWGE